MPSCFTDSSSHDAPCRCKRATKHLAKKVLIFNDAVVSTTANYWPFFKDFLWLGLLGFCYRRVKGKYQHLFFSRLLPEGAIIISLFVSVPLTVGRGAEGKWNELLLSQAAGRVGKHDGAPLPNGHWFSSSSPPFFLFFFNSVSKRTDLNDSCRVWYCSCLQNCTAYVLFHFCTRSHMDYLEKGYFP